MIQLSLVLHWVLAELAGGFAELVGQIALKGSKQAFFSEGTREFLKVLAEEEFAAADKQATKGAKLLQRAAEDSINSSTFPCA